MKEVLDRAGIRTPRNERVSTASGLREAATRIGFPLVVKPVSGAGSADTYRLNEAKEVEAVLPKVHHVRELSVEEFIDGEEYTFDTICHDGRILYYNVAHYRPRPLIARTVQWISPQTLARRELETAELRPGVEMGKRVIAAMGFQTGFTHMEWFLKPNGEAVFGEIAARPPGARTVDIMNFASDVDLFLGWAEAVCHGRLTQSCDRMYNAAVIFKRAQGDGRIQRIEGLERLLTRFGPYVASVDLLPVGAPRRNWKQTLLSDGSLVVRHPDLATCEHIADAVGTDLQLYAA
jgi:biotin carboxylase